jgi:hypothetical protein
MTKLQDIFLDKAKVGNRNSAIMQYALALIRIGISKSTIISSIKEMNAKLSRPLTETELENTIIDQVNRKYS